MARSQAAAAPAAPTVRASEAPRQAVAATPLFEAVYVFGMIWTIIGATLDGWAHNHLSESLETFFTPWHATMYSGVMFTGVTLAVFTLIHWRRGLPLFKAIPVGYGWSALGAVIVVLSGAGDGIWHTLFGIEFDVEAAISPTHLLGVFGGFMMFAGPLRAAWGKPISHPSGWKELYPAIAGIWCIATLLSITLQVNHPMVHAVAIARYEVTEEQARYVYQAGALAGIVMHMTLLIGYGLLAIRRWHSRLPLGMFTVIFTANAGLLSVQQDQYRLIPAWLAAGLLFDGLLRWLKPTPENPYPARIIAATVPAALMLIYFGILSATDTVWWSVHLTYGSAAIAALFGFFASYLAFPPPIPAETS